MAKRLARPGAIILVELIDGRIADHRVGGFGAGCTPPVEISGIDLGQLFTGMFVPQEAVMSIPPNLAPIRAMFTDQIDAQAEAARAGHLTAGEGQAMTYLYKADEARRWTESNAAVTPFLTAEAAARDMTMADLANEVLTAIAQWTFFGAKIEAARMGAKTAIAAATNLPELAAAGHVDWQALLTA